MSFGNSPSTVRQFRRVSSGGPVSYGQLEQDSRSTPGSKVSSSQASTLVGQDENTPPHCGPETPSGLGEQAPKLAPIPITPIALTKESLMGRRAYSKAVEASFTSQLSHTAEPSHREALARLSTAWTVLDRVDPEGEFLLLKAIVDRVKAEPKLAAALGLHPPPSCRLGPAPPSALPSATPTLAEATAEFVAPERRVQGRRGGGDDAAGAEGGEVPARKKKQQWAQEEGEGGGQEPEQPDDAGFDTSPSKPRLVLAQNNPHLKSHRRRQSAIVGAVDMRRLDDERRATEEKRLPGFVPPGMEQTAGVADALYNGWLEGLKARWGLA